MLSMVTVQWKGGMAFESTPESGCTFTMDAYPEVGGQNLGPTPVEALLSSLAACTGMDVISILQKKRQEVSSYRIEVSGVRMLEGAFPRPFTGIKVIHFLTGPNLDPVAVARAIELSDEKYCTVAATLRANPVMISEFVIEQSVVGE